MVYPIEKNVKNCCLVFSISQAHPLHASSAVYCFLDISIKYICTSILKKQKQLQLLEHK